MKRFYEWADVLFTVFCKCLLAVLSCEGLFLAVMILFNEVLNTDLLLNHRNLIDPVQAFLLMPWSGALLGFYLARKDRRSGLDIHALTLLVLWLAIPFTLRFGTESLTLHTVFGYSVCFFVLYASVCASDAHRRGRQLDVACAAICLISLFLGGALLYCAWAGKVLYSYPNTQGFGVPWTRMTHATNSNLTAIMAIVCLFFCLTGLCRSRKKPCSILYLLGTVIMALVVVLTLGRAARYAMLAAFALGTWNALNEYLPVQRPLLRQGLALTCAAVVLIGGYFLCSFITNAALEHYTTLPSSRLFGASVKARNPLDSTFSGRITIWKNLFESWKENPWHMLIGSGSGRSRWNLAKGLDDIAYIEAHNAYLYFVAEFGLIGFAMLLVFLCSVLKPVLRVFFAHGKARMPGGCALCMLIVALLLIGMMEIRPLEAMTTSCLAFFFALGQLVGAGREMR